MASKRNAEGSADGFEKLVQRWPKRIEVGGDFLEQLGSVENK